MSEKIIRLAVIGCGLAANDLHFPAFEELTDSLRVSAVCNHSEEKAIQFAKRCGDIYGADIPWFTDYREAIQRPDVDAVVILLPVELNLQVAKFAFKAGKHVLVEKPVAVDLSEAQQMYDLSREYPKLKLMVAENFRYKHQFEVIRNALREGVIGRLNYVDCISWMQMSPDSNKYARTSWRIEHKYAGGFVTDGGVHFIAALRDMLGDLQHTGSMKWCANPAIGDMDALVMNFNTSGLPGIDAARGTMHLNYSVNGINEMKLRFLGSEGSIEADWENIKVFHNTDGQRDESLTQTLPFVNDGGYSAEYKDFIRSIESGAPPISSVEEAVTDLETIMIAIERAV